MNKCKTICKSFQEDFDREVNSFLTKNEIISIKFTTISSNGGYFVAFITYKS